MMKATYAAVVAVGSCAQVLCAQCDPVWSALGPVNEGYYGRQVLNVGDLDGDGDSEVIVRYDTSTSGDFAIDFLSGSDGALLREGLGYYLEFSAAPLGDLDGDGIGEWIEGGAGFGVHIISGFEERIWTEWDEFGTETFGSGNFACGDLDGDGVTEFIIGDSSYDADGGSNHGRAILYSGATKERLHQFVGESGQSLGAGGERVGDLNGDGIDDLVIHGWGWSGVVRVYSGADYSHLYSITDQGGRFGNSIAPVGDIDGDEAADYVCGSSLASRVCLVSGASGLILTERLGDAMEPLGGVVSVGDWNQDGVRDIAIESPRASRGGDDVGRVIFCSGDDLRIIDRYQGPGPSQQFGSAVATVTGLPGQTRPAVAIGSREYDFSLGRVDLFVSTCRADFNCDGAADTRDVTAFLNAFVAGEWRADANFDNVVNTQDVLAFLNLWAVGCG